MKVPPELLAILDTGDLDLSKSVATELGTLVGRSVVDGTDLDELAGRVADRADTKDGREGAVWVELTALYRRWAGQGQG